MTDTKLITVSSLAPYKDISANIDDAERFDPYILEAQVHDIKPLLGEALYHALITAYESSPVAERFTDLIEGKDYTPTGDTYQIRFYGLTPMIAYFAYGRFLENQNYHVTRAGIKYKNAAESERVGEEKINTLSATAKGKALAYVKGLECFLSEYSTTYPEYNCVTRHTGGGLKVISVRKADYVKPYRQGQ